MTPGEISRGVGLGLLVWFFAALYFGVLVEAALPARAERLRNLANAAFLPMAMISALVLVRQGQRAALTRLAVALAGGGVLWFVTAAGVGGLLVTLQPRWATEPVLRAVNALVLIVAFPLVWWISGRISLFAHPPSPNLP